MKDSEHQKNIEISILCISYNHELYIKQALDSALMQRLPVAFEIVVADDCSTDNTPHIIEELRKEHPNIIRVLHREKNFGFLRNLQDAFAACKGKYIAILECDDYWICKYKLRKQYDALRIDPQALFCFSNITLLFQELHAIAPHIPIIKQQFDKKITLKDLIVHMNPIGNFSCCMYKKEALAYIPPSYYEDVNNADWLFHMYLLDNSPYAPYIHQSLSMYRQHATSAYSSKAPTEKNVVFPNCLQRYSKLFHGEHQDIFAEALAKIK